MNRIFVFCICFCLCLPVLGCSAVEPEELYLVSAFGVDRTDAGVRIVAEVPLTRETAADEMEVRLFEGEGETLSSALVEMKKGLAKKMDFGHCALAVFGKDVEGEIGRAHV